MRSCRIVLEENRSVEFTATTDEIVPPASCIDKGCAGIVELFRHAPEALQSLRIGRTLTEELRGDHSDPVVVNVNQFLCQMQPVLKQFFRAHTPM